MIAVPSYIEKIQNGCGRTYFPHIDGLRCLAIIPVVLYHLNSNLCPGGFVGVDIFFVISGYLIVGGIADGLRSGTFSMTSFYHHRIRRIFPAYFVVVFFTLSVAVAIYPWSRLVPIAQTALFSAIFSTNIYFWLDMGYFRPIANANPLLHLWTLGVEEQFYIIIPLLCLLVCSVYRRLLNITLLLLLIASFSICLWMGLKGNSTTAFYLLPTRAWELLAGALLASSPNRNISRCTSFLVIPGLICILLPFWLFNTSNTYDCRGTNIELILPYLGSAGIFPFPGLAAVPVVVGTLLLIQYGASGPISHILTSGPFVGVGKISYSLYLWHWPIVVFARHIEYDKLSHFSIYLVFVLSLVAAFLSWRFVEMPIRTCARFTPKIAFLSVGIGCGFLIAASTLLILTNGFRNLIHPEANKYAAPPRSFVDNLDKFRSIPRFSPPPYPLLDVRFVRRIGAQSQHPSFCLLGDSHAEALCPGLDRVASDNHRSGYYITLKMHPYVDEGSTADRQKLIEWVGANPDIHDVYLVGRWLEEYRISNGLPRLGDKGHVKATTLDRKTEELIELNFRNTAQWFIQRGKRVFVFNSVPDYGYAPADLMARSKMFPLLFPIEITRSDYLNRQKPITKILTSLERDGLITVVPLESGLLSDDHTVFMSPEGFPYYIDADHLTPEGAYRASKAIAPFLWPENPAKESGKTTR